jgi:predicted  nucleic acid-binding Zn-ribbon protein
MGFGSTAKKLQKVTEYAEKLYDRFEKLRNEVEALRETVEDTNDRVATLERQLAEQRALVEALAEQDGVDVEAAVGDAASVPETAADGGSDGES